MKNEGYVDGWGGGELSYVVSQELLFRKVTSGKSVLRSLELHVAVVEHNVHSGWSHLGKGSG